MFPIGWSLGFLKDSRRVPLLSAAGIIQNAPEAMWGSTDTFQRPCVRNPPFIWTLVTTERYTYIKTDKRIPLHVLIAH